MTGNIWAGIPWQYVSYMDDIFDIFEDLKKEQRENNKGAFAVPGKPGIEPVAMMGGACLVPTDLVAATVAFISGYETGASIRMENSQVNGTITVRESGVYNLIAHVGVTGFSTNDSSVDLIVDADGVQTVIDAVYIGTVKHDYITFNTSSSRRLNSGQIMKLGILCTSNQTITIPQSTFELHRILQ